MKKLLVLLAFIPGLAFSQGRFQVGDRIIFSPEVGTKGQHPVTVTYVGTTHYGAVYDIKDKEDIFGEAVEIEIEYGVPGSGMYEKVK